MRKKFIKLLLSGILGILAVGLVIIALGVFYWWKLLPAEDVVLGGQKTNDIFRELRSPDNQLYSDSLSPILLAGLNLQHQECRNIKGRETAVYNGALITYLRSKGARASFCAGDTKACWPLEKVLVTVSAAIKYSAKARTELFLMLGSVPPIGIACERIVGHSCHDMSPDEAVIVSRWVLSPSLLMDGKPDIQSVRDTATKIASACNKEYVPPTSMVLIPPYQDGRLPHVVFSYNRLKYRKNSD